MPSINAVPPVLDLSLYAGDGITFRLICKDENGEPVNITGDVDAQVRLDRTPENTLIVDFRVDLGLAEDGIIILNLDGEQTQELIDDPSSKKQKFSGVWDAQWNPTGEEPRTLCQGKVECVADVTR